MGDDEAEYKVRVVVLGAEGGVGDGVDVRLGWGRPTGVGSRGRVCCCGFWGFRG